MLSKNDIFVIALNINKKYKFKLRRSMCNIKNHPTLSYRLINNVTGWVAFVVASITYILTVEPTASLWDCGEFITTSVGLQVGHPPGAPLFMIISRLFAIFAPSPETQSYRSTSCRLYVPGSRSCSCSGRSRIWLKKSW